MTEHRQVTVTQALGRFFAAAVNVDFPEGHGLDSDGSPVSEAADIAELLAKGDRAGALTLLADPGIDDDHDALRTALQEGEGEADHFTRCGGEPGEPTFYGKDSEAELASGLDGYCRGCPDCTQPSGEEGEGLVAEFRERSEHWQRERAKTKAAETADRASGKIGPNDTYTATWNYYEGLARAYEWAAQRLEGREPHSAPWDRPAAHPHDQEAPQVSSGLEIDATEFAEARRDPKVKDLLRRADEYGRSLGDRGSLGLLGGWLRRRGCDLGGGGGPTCGDG